MAHKHRLNGQAFTCSNYRFDTKTNAGKPHGAGQASGSVFDTALVTHPGGYSLWLEHVTDKQGGPDVFWLMWYDQNGDPTIPASGVLDLQQLRDVAKGLIDYAEPK